MQYASESCLWLSSKSFFRGWCCRWLFLNNRPVCHVFLASVSMIENAKMGWDFFRIEKMYEAHEFNFFQKKGKETSVLLH